MAGRILDPTDRDVNALLSINQMAKLQLENIVLLRLLEEAEAKVPKKKVTK